MRVAWIADPGNQNGSIGGAELTQAEFRAAAPDGVDIIDVPAEQPELARDADAACVFNCVTYPAALTEALEGKRVVRYWNDMAPHGSPILTRWLLDNATSVFCSPLHRDRFPWGAGSDSRLIPPPVDLERFRRAARGANGRAGAVSVGSWMNPGKAPQLVKAWAANNEPVEFYGMGPFAPAGTTPVAYRTMPDLLARFKTFVFLPSAVEPFGRLIAEAHAAGCDIVTNQLVGARWWLENQQHAIDTAAADFWGLVCG